MLDTSARQFRRQPGPQRALGRFRPAQVGERNDDVAGHRIDEEAGAARNGLGKVPERTLFRVHVGWPTGGSARASRREPRRLRALAGENADHETGRETSARG